MTNPLVITRPLSLAEQASLPDAWARLTTSRMPRFACGSAAPTPANRPFVDMEYPFRLQPDRAAIKLARRRREATIWLAAAAALLLGFGGGDGYVAGRWAEARWEMGR